ncbi:MAG: HlyC/CorC family transporter [Deltaproteobacteria bacterium]|nr:HlyC/CorC family transporter [Deltaproteobacteria bacterium]
MDDPSSILLLTLLILLLICSGFFSGTETALFSLNRVERRRLKEGKSVRSQLIAKALQRPRELLSTILFGNTLVNVATSVTATLLFQKLLTAHSLAAAIVVDSLLVLFIGEIIPKTIAVNQALPLSRAAIKPLRFFAKLSSPLVWVFDRSASGVLRALKVPEEAGGALSPSEVEILFEEAGRRETITPEERRIARNIMRFSETTTEEIMTPRVDVAAAPLDISREALEQMMIEARHSRIPIYEGSIDHVVGFVSTKEFFLNPNREIRELLKPVAIFPEGARVHRVFRHMQKDLLNMAVIVNEYGVTSGIVTMEDLVEEIVGEIYDEYEKAEELIQPVGSDEWLVLCRAPIEDVNDACGLSLPEGESVTLNGYLCDEFGEIPVPGRAIERNGARFTIEQSTRSRILSCRVKRLVERAAADDV